MTSAYFSIIQGSNADSTSIRMTRRLARTSCLLSLLLVATACGCAQDYDRDGDGYGAPVDCNDADPSTHPSADERCDGIDNDCDSEVDEHPVDDGTRVHNDRDGDGFGEAEEFLTCTVTSAHSLVGTDCDDDDASIYPRERYVDADRDGFGGSETRTHCGPLIAGLSTITGDCNDSASGVFPGNPEVCDGQDNDCNGLMDTADPGLPPSELTTSYADADFDGYGDPDVVNVGCGVPFGYELTGGDCDDADWLVRPGVTEICGDQIDNNCNGSVDESAYEEYGDAPVDISAALASASAGSPYGVSPRGAAELRLCAGTYYIEIDTTHSFSLFGEGSDITTIDGGGTNRAIHMSGNNQTLRVEGVRITDAETGGNGAAIICESSSESWEQSDLFISDVRIDSSYASFEAAALLVDGCTVDAVDMVVENNQSGWTGGAARLIDTSATFERCSFLNNRSINGSAGAIDLDYSFMTFRNGAIEGNSSAQWAGGVYVDAGSSVDFTNVQILDNLSGGDHSNGIYFHSIPGTHVAGTDMTFSNQIPDIRRVETGYPAELYDASTWTNFRCDGLSCRSL